MTRKAVYAGSFDPPTNGHMFMIREGARLFDELVVAVGDNPDKRSTFSVDNGNYSANLRGPLRFEGVALGGVELSPVNLDGSIDVNGRLDLRDVSRSLLLDAIRECLLVHAHPLRSWACHLSEPASVPLLCGPKRLDFEEGGTETFVCR